MAAACHFLTGDMNRIEQRSKGTYLLNGKPGIAKADMVYNYMRCRFDPLKAGAIIPIKALFSY